MKNRSISFLVFILLIPITFVIGEVFFADRSYVFITFGIVVLSLIGFLISFEKKELSTRFIVVIAVMIAISVAGRFLFLAVPGFKPVTAIVILTAIYFGAEAGFLVGALTALISNIYFGQGPWTPFQMFSWGIIGFIAGLPYIRRYLLQSKWTLMLFGALAGVLFSLLMDIWTVISIDGGFNFKRYISMVVLAIPFMVTYAVSNVIFLLLTVKPIGSQLERVKLKFDI